MVVLVRICLHFGFEPKVIVVHLIWLIAERFLSLTQTLTLLLDQNNRKITTTTASNVMCKD